MRHSVRRMRLSLCGSARKSSMLTFVGLRLATVLPRSRIPVPAHTRIGTANRTASNQVPHPLGDSDLDMATAESDQRSISDENCWFRHSWIQAATDLGGGASECLNSSHFHVTYERPRRLRVLCLNSKWSLGSAELDKLCRFCIEASGQHAGSSVIGGRESRWYGATPLTGFACGGKLD